MNLKWALILLGAVTLSIILFYWFLNPGDKDDDQKENNDGSK